MMAMMKFESEPFVFVFSSFFSSLIKSLCWWWLVFLGVLVFFGLPAHLVCICIFVSFLLDLILVTSCTLLECYVTFES
ncbi:hypothetical protein HanHA89_Chr12g0453361 [Helianthus annuus]|nr:hypothetical protein HanHA89_Chr12g0453361 [Helianthus annuus]